MLKFLHFVLPLCPSSGVGRRYLPAEPAVDELMQMMIWSMLLTEVTPVIKKVPPWTFTADTDGFVPHVGRSAVIESTAWGVHLTQMSQPDVKNAPSAHSRRQLGERLTRRHSKMEQDMKTTRLLGGRKKEILWDFTTGISEDERGLCVYESLNSDPVKEDTSSGDSHIRVLFSVNVFGCSSEWLTSDYLSIKLFPQLRVLLSVLPSGFLHWACRLYAELVLPPS